MEGNMGDYWDKKSLIINELIQGKELAKQLQMHLNIASSSSSSSSLQNQEYLVQKILNSYEKVLSILNENNDMSPILRRYEAPEQQQQQPPPPPVVTGAGVIFGTCLSESPPSRPHSLSESPRSEEYSDQDHEQNKDASKKRKSMPRWTKQVQVCPTGTGLEGTLEDGCSWRKYGQKDILGAKFPRAYYRCTHRNIQGCLATKQVQRSDEDPTIFEITYRGRHTCFQSSNTHPNPSSSSIISTSPPEKKQELELFHQQQQPQQEVLFNFKTGLKVITQDLEDDHVVTHHDNNAFELPSFYFPSISSSDIRPENPTFMPSLHDHNNFMMSSSGGYSPSFVSPATSGSNHFSSASSSTNSLTTIGGIDFPNFGQPEFDPNFTFDNPGFFP